MEQYKQDAPSAMAPPEFRNVCVLPNGASPFRIYAGAVVCVCVMPIYIYIYIYIHTYILNLGPHPRA